MTTRKKKNKHVLEGENDICSKCGSVRRRTELYCRGREERKEPMLEFLACRCLHPGDYLCNCGKPCYSFF